MVYQILFTPLKCTLILDIHCWYPMYSLRLAPQWFTFTSILFLSRHWSAKTECCRRRFVIWRFVVHNTYRSQCTCIFTALGWYSENDYGFYLWIYLPGLWIHNHDYEYYVRSVHLLYIQLVTKPYTCGFPAGALSTFVIKLLRQC